MHRNTVLTNTVYPEMYQDTIFMIEIYPDMYHDTVSLSVSSRFSCVLLFGCCTRASLMLFDLSNTRLFRCFISRFTVESVQCRNESIRKNPVSRVVQRTLGKYAALSGVVDQVGTWLFSLLTTRLETWNSRGMYMDLSRGMKVNEFADATASEFVSGETQHCVEWSEALGNSRVHQRNTRSSET